MRTATPGSARAVQAFPVAAPVGMALGIGIGIVTVIVMVIVMVIVITGAACSPQPRAVDGGAEDFSQLRRDLRTGCEPLPVNLLGNPGFEEPSPGAPDGNGQAVSRGNPPSSIPGGALGPWDGCCSQAAGGTSWSVRMTMPHCGARAVAVSSDQADANVLNQRVDLAAYSGRSVRASAWVFIAQVSGSGSGSGSAELAIDLFDLTASRVIASSAPLTATTADWRFLSAMGQVPTGGAVQVRIRSTGSFTAVIDDIALTPQ